MQQEKMSSAHTQTASSPVPLINLSGLSGNGSDANPPSGTPRRRRRWIIVVVVLLLVLLVGGLILRAAHRRSQVTYQTGQVTRGNLTITVNATGPLQSGTYNLIFNGTGGKIDQIDVSVGQKVKKGQVLARLDQTALQDAVNQAQTAVNNAQASLAAANASANSSSNNAGVSVSAAQTAVADAQNSQTQTQTQAQAGVNAAQTTLTNAQNNLTQVKTTANQQKQAAATAYNATTYATTTGGTTTTTACPHLGTFTNANTLPTACLIAYNTYLTTVNQANTNVTAAQAQVNTAQQSLNQAEASQNANNVTAQNQVNTAQNQVNSAESGAGVSETSGQSAVVAAQNQLNTAQDQLTQAKHNLANATLTAPRAGTVTIINGTVGGTPGGTSASSAGSTAGSAFIQIVDLSALQVQANINEADMADLQMGESASFTVNAYGTQSFTGTISSIPPTGETTSNVVTYPVVISVDESSLKGAHLLPGMTANVTINAVQHKNALLIPVNAINFARLASSGNSSGGTPQLVSVQDANKALNQARTELDTLEVANPGLVLEGPMPAFVIEQSGKTYVAKPVVLGLTDGISYEVLQGLALNETFLVGTNS